MIKIIKIKNFEVGLKFLNGKLTEALRPGWHVVKTILGETVDIIAEKDLFVFHPEIDQIISSGFLCDKAEIVDLKYDERALLWTDNLFYCILGPGKHVIWKTLKKVKVETLLVENPKFDSRNLYQIGKNFTSKDWLETVQVEQGEVCMYFCDGKFVEELASGFYAFWKGVSSLKFFTVSRKEKVLDLSGQEIITADKVSLRLNAVVSFKISDALKFVTVCDSSEISLYRECQLAMRTSVGARSIDELLAGKDQLAVEISNTLRAKASDYGIDVVGFGIRDIILPGEMREIMNRVVSAQKEAEANQIIRREETAATRSQFNTAKMLENNPTLMRLRELEVIERVAEKSKMNLFLGDKGLTERLVNLL